MSFVSVKFIALVLAAFLLYYKLPRRAQPYVLLFSSYAYYALAAGWLCLLFMVITTVITYAVGLMLDSQALSHKRYMTEHRADFDADPELKREERARNIHVRRVILAIGLLPDLGLLVVLKYSNFAIFNINKLTGASIRFMDIVLPLGISFYTFMAVGYLIDVYHAKVEAQGNLAKLALFVSFFPAVSQGPISRYGELAQTLYEPHPWDSGTFCRGMQRVLWGYAKKMVIADRAAIGVKALAAGTEYTGVYVVVTMVLYTIQLYADFSGGIDITIGIAEALGIRLAENFERPLFSKCLKEYWRRWHITMGTWFRDYIFYPMSTSKLMRKIPAACKKHGHTRLAKRLPVYIASGVTWLATGIWHGASWNFVAWGMLTYVILMVSEEMEPLYDRFHHSHPHATMANIPYKCLCVVRTLFITSALKLFDCYATVGETFKRFGSIFVTPNWGRLVDGSILQIGLTAGDYAVLIVGVIVMFIVSFISRSVPARDRLRHIPWVFRYLLYVLLFMSIVVFGVYGVGYDATAFIYNQF